MTDLATLITEAQAAALRVIEATIADLQGEPPDQEQMRAAMDALLQERDPAVYDVAIGRLQREWGPEEFERQLRLAGSRLLGRAE